MTNYLFCQIWKLVPLHFIVVYWNFPHPLFTPLQKPVPPTFRSIPESFLPDMFFFFLFQIYCKSMSKGGGNLISARQMQLHYLNPNNLLSEFRIKSNIVICSLTFLTKGDYFTFLKRDNLLMFPKSILTSKGVYYYKT
jgi:hypothetical protein